MLEGLKLKFPISKGNDGFFSQIEIKLEGKKIENWRDEKSGMDAVTLFLTANSQLANEHQ